MDRARHSPRDRYYELFERAPIAYLTLERDGTIVEANLAASNAFRMARSELVGRRFASLVSSEHVDVFCVLWRRLFESGGIQRCEMSFETPGRRRFPGRLEASVASASGLRDGKSAVCMAVVDLTEVERDPDPVDHIADALYQQKLDTFGLLASCVAHDFNNILMGIGGCAQIALDQLDPGSAARIFLEEIASSAETSGAITKQLLSITRGQSAEPTVFELSALVSARQTLLRRLVGEDIEMSFRLDAKNSRVRADMGQLEQVLVNLAVNARQAMPRGGRLEIATGETVLSSDEAAALDLSHGRYVLLSVSDDGVGMSEEVQRRLFEPFYSTKKAGEGTGLGLSIVKAIVLRAGGGIRVDSAPGRGSRFEILLPKARSRITRELPPPPSGVSRRDESSTILVVEDDRTVRMALRYHLEGAGYATLEARNGPDAIECLKSYPRSIDLLLTDLLLPGVNGDEVAREATRLKPGIKVIFISGHSAHVLAEQRTLARDVAVLQKPFGGERLLERVRESLSPSD